MSNRDNVLNKIRAILAKTVDNGCTEDEVKNKALQLWEKECERNSSAFAAIAKPYRHDCVYTHVKVKNGQ